MSTESHNNTYLFTLVLRGVSKITIDLENDLFESGCDDALLHSNNGSIFLEFNRKDASLENAVNSAIGNVKKCKNIEVAVVEPADYVTIAEIARRASLTREYIRKLAKGERGVGGFPSPLAGASAKTLIYSWVEVSGWLSKNDILKNSDELKTAIFIKKLNDELNSHWKAFY